MSSRLALLLGFVTFASAVPLSAVAETLDALRARIGPTQEELALDGVHYFALERGGVAVVDAADPQNVQLLTTLAPDRIIADLILEGRTLYLIEQRFEARPFDLAEPRAPRPSVGRSMAVPVSVPTATVAVEPKPEPPAPTGRVIEVAQGRVLIEGGTDGGFARGKRVRITSQRMIDKPDLLRGGTRRTASNETSAVIELEDAEESRSMAILGRGDGAEPGDLVTLTDEPLSERLLFPRRAPFSFRAGFHARPFLGLASDSKPVGILIDANVAWIMPWLPVVIEAQVAPAGLVLGGRERHGPVALMVTAGWITDFFEIGLGAGVLAGVEGPCYDASVPPEPIRIECEENTGVTFNQTMRLGALDGLNLMWRSSVFSRPDQFAFGMGRGELNVPLTSRFGLFGAGGGGANGWAFGELGVRTYTGGAGARGTMILSASLGVVSISDGPNYESVTGPTVSFGMEWRF